MGHSYSNALFHCVWSTKERHKSLSADVRLRLGKYLGGIARANNMKVFAVGGMEDHVHVLLSVPATISLAKAVQLLKGGSSKWIHECFPTLRDFAWQEGYGAFSIGVSGLDETKAYIEKQEEHYRVRTFEEEFQAFLIRHGLSFDPRYVFG